MNILSDIDKGGIPFYTKESIDSFQQKSLVQLAQIVVTTNENDSNANGPSLVNKEVLDNILIHIMMFTYQETQENPIANNEETSTQVQDDSHQV